MAKIVEVTATIKDTVNKNDDIKPIMRNNFGSEIISKVDIAALEGLKKGDKVKVTIEKI